MTLRFTDRTRTTLDWNCRRARYWGFEHDARGLSPQTPNEDLLFGIEMAKQTANIKTNQPWRVDGFSPHMQEVGEVLCYGYEKIVWPRWLRDFDLVEVEAEKPKQLTEWLIYNSKPDTIMRRRSDNTLWYGPEDKTTRWVDSLLNYAKDVQLHATALCIEDHLKDGETIAGALVQGLYKGFVKEDKLYHPLIYAYVKEGIPGIMPDQWNEKWVRNWNRENTKFYAGGRGAWIDSRSESVIGEVFPMSPPILLRRDLVKNYFAQVGNREYEIAAYHAAKDTLGLFQQTFPQNFSQCDQFSKGRSPCPYHALCWNPTAQKYPMSLYKHREPHHENEAAAFRGE